MRNTQICVSGKMPMAWHLTSYKPVLEPVLAHYQLSSQYHILMKFETMCKHFFQQCAFKYVIWKLYALCTGHRFLWQHIIMTLRHDHMLGTKRNYDFQL